MKRLSFLFVCFLVSTLQGRSIFRPPECYPALIRVWSSIDPRVYELRDSHLRAEHLFRIYNEDFLLQHRLPAHSTIALRYGGGSISTDELSEKIEHLLEEVAQQKEKYRDFIPLSRKDFKRHQKKGVLVVQLKNTPLVVKLYIGKPSSLTSPYVGFESSIFFLAGGATRHTLGFSRIPNLVKVQRIIQKCPVWCNRIAFPRKWFWLPKKMHWLEIEAHNIGQVGVRRTKLPATYAIICDKLEKNDEKAVTLEESLGFCTRTGYLIDPHVPNFFVEKESGKIALIDTEYFPWFMGFREQIPHCANYTLWYSCLIKKTAREKFGACKEERERRHLGGYDTYYDLWA